MAFSAISDCLGLLGWPPVVVQEEHSSSVGLVSNMPVLHKSFEYTEDIRDIPGSCHFPQMQLIADKCQILWYHDVTDRYYIPALRSKVTQMCLNNLPMKAYNY